MKASLLPHYRSPDEFRIINITEQEANGSQPVITGAFINPADTLVRKDRFGALRQLKKDRSERLQPAGRFER